MGRYQISGNLYGRKDSWEREGEVYSIVAPKDAKEMIDYCEQDVAEFEKIYGCWLQELEISESWRRKMKMYENFQKLIMLLKSQDTEFSLEVGYGKTQTKFPYARVVSYDFVNRPYVNFYEGEAHVWISLEDVAEFEWKELVFGNVLRIGLI